MKATRKILMKCSFSMVSCRGDIGPSGDVYAITVVVKRAMFADECGADGLSCARLDRDA